MIPDGMPTLSQGCHRPDQGQACVMEYVSVITGSEWTDTPRCTNRLIARAAIILNDRLTDEDRHLLVPFIHRLAAAGFYSYSLDMEIRGTVRNSLRMDDWYSALYLEHGVGQEMKERVTPVVVDRWVTITGQKFPLARGYNPEAGIAYLTELLDLHDKHAGRVAPPISEDALQKARALIETGARI